MVLQVQATPSNLSASIGYLYYFEKQQIKWMEIDFLPEGCV